MGRLVVYLSFISLATLEVGSFLFPSAPIMWLANTLITYNIVRAAVILLLLVLLLASQFVRLPVVLRLIVGGVALSGVIAIVALTYKGNMSVMDSLALSAASVSAGILAAEGHYEAVPDVSVKALRRARQRQTRTLAHLR